MKTKKPTKGKKISKSSYIWAIGRGKTAVARVRLYSRRKGKVTVNDKPIEEYFPGKALRERYLSPLRCCNVIDKYLITIKVVGSGKIGQLKAVLHGVSRVLVKLDEDKYKLILKKRGFLTRDSRKRERRKVGTGGKARRKKQSPRR